MESGSISAERDVAEGAGEHFHGGGDRSARANGVVCDVFWAASVLAPAERGRHHVDALSEASRRAGLAASELSERRDAVRLGAGRDGRGVARELQGRDAADRGGHDRRVRGGGQSRGI